MHDGVARHARLKTSPGTTGQPFGASCRHHTPGRQEAMLALAPIPGATNGGWLAMFAEFAFEGVKYTVSGWVWSPDGDQNGIIVHLADGSDVPGAVMHPGMVQLGIPPALEQAAIEALEAERKRGLDTED